MISALNWQECTGCYACCNVCPAKCIDMLADREGFFYPRADAARCINCGFCQSVCPVMQKTEPANTLCAYAAYNKNDAVRSESSSGGLFSLIAEVILQKGGVVFGAGFDSRFQVKHGCIETVEELNRFRGSKYVQSRIGGTFQQAKAFLEQGRWVLFSGTPCQIAGLKSYLKKDYARLYCQDIVCHGVPSPGVWQKYLDYRRARAGSVISEINFRKKTPGWTRYSVSFTFKNRTEYICGHQEDPMMKVFLSNLCLRPSCYHCKFKGENRLSDITLADFWGIRNILPGMDDDKGISLVLIHSRKGRELFESIKNNIAYQPVEISAALKNNPAAFFSVQPHKKRSRFFKNLNRYDFERLVKKYGDPPSIRWKGRILRLIETARSKFISLLK